MTVNKQNTDRVNRGQLSPGVDDVTNRYHRNTYEFARAQPRDVVNRTRRDHEELRAMEGLAFAAAPGFYQGVDSADRATVNQYDLVQAGQQGGRVEPGRSNPPAVWEFVPEAALSAFSQAADFGEPGRSRPMDMSVRDGARANLAPRSGLQRGERVNNATIVHSVEESAPWRYRRPNAATVKD
jgi:hypothetical protein